MRFHFSGTPLTDKALDDEQTKIDPHRRECEREPGYNWRTDTYYSEANIRARLQASTEAQRKTNTIAM